MPTCTFPAWIDQRICHTNQSQYQHQWKLCTHITTSSKKYPKTKTTKKTNKTLKCPNHNKTHTKWRYNCQIERVVIATNLFQRKRKESLTIGIAVVNNSWSFLEYETGKSGFWEFSWECWDSCDGSGHGVVKKREKDTWRGSVGWVWEVNTREREENTSRWHTWLQNLKIWDLSHFAYTENHTLLTNKLHRLTMMDPLFFFFFFFVGLAYIYIPNISHKKKKIDDDILFILLYVLQL